MIIEWAVIAIFVFLGLFYLKMEHHAHKVKILIIIIVGFVIYFSVVNHFSSEQVDTTSPRGIINGVYLYAGWVGQTTSSLWNIGTDTVVLVGNAIKIDNIGKEEEEE
jgi:hypothetical protein